MLLVRQRHYQVFWALPLPPPYLIHFWQFYASSFQFQLSSYYGRVEVESLSLSSQSQVRLVSGPRCAVLCQFYDLCECVFLLVMTAYDHGLALKLWNYNQMSKNVHSDTVCLHLQVRFYMFVFRVTKSVELFQDRFMFHFLLRADSRS